MYGCSIPPSTLTINLSSIGHNLKSFIKRCGSVMAMVKANAYGTDLIHLSKFISTLGWKEIPFLGVSHVSEGIQLREAGITLPIFVISVPPYEAEYAAAYKLTAAVSTAEEAEALNLHGRQQGRIIPVHLLIDTGMNRSGAPYQMAHHLFSVITECPNLLLEGVWTHFASAESPQLDFFTEEQTQEFKTFVTSLPIRPKWIHAANSGGAARFDLPFCNLARIGLGYVGCGPNLGDAKCPLSLKTKLTAIKLAKKGETVGYDLTYTIPQESARIGVIPFGYYDGYPRMLSQKGHVMIRDKKAPILGIVCMDFMMIDLTHIPEANAGDEVILFDQHLTAETVASWSGRNVREFLVKIPSRVKRSWENDKIKVENDIPTCSEPLSNPIFSFEANTASR